MTPWLMAALAMGAAGSAHCLGMCGPIALAVPSYAPTPRARWFSTLLLNGGRLVTYVLLGAAVGVLGLGMRLAGLQQAVTIAAGGLLLLSVLVPGALRRWSPQSAITTGLGRLRARLARHLGRNAPEAIFLSGLLNGLLPCGLLYTALLGAATMGSTAESMLFMALFGLGTWPTLVALRMTGGSIGQVMRARLRRVAPALIAVVALLLILRGMELGIPYLSPMPAASMASGAACH